MDRKQLITSITVAVAVLGLYWAFVHILERVDPQLFTMPAPPEQPMPATQPSTTQAAAPTSQNTTQPTVVAVPTTTPATGPAVAQNTQPAPPPAPPPAAIVAVGAPGQPQSVMLGAATSKTTPDSKFTMGVVLSPTGAAIDSVTLNRFGSANVRLAPKVPYTFQQPYPGHPDSGSLQSRSIVINGITIDLSQVNWRLVPGNSPTSVAFELPLVDAAGKHVAMLRKTYTLTPANNDKKTSQGYEISVDLTVENQSKAPLAVRTTYNGPTMPPQEMDRSDDRIVIVATSTGPSTLTVAQHYLAEFKPEHAEMDLSKDALWTGEASAYFNAIVRPDPTSITDPSAAKYTIKATALEPQNLKNTPPQNTDPFVVITYSTDDRPVAVGQTLSLKAEVFFGPKWRDLLTTPYYTAYPLGYDQSLIIHGSCSFLTFGWLVWTLVAIVNAFHHVTFDWGLAIICLVCLVRVCLHPITKRAQVNMMSMGKMAPEMERLKKKYGDDKDALNKAMMDVYKDQGLAPILGCLPMFLQMPIWIALWGALQSTFELRQAPFLWGFTWIKDLAKPDGVPYLWWPNHPIVIPLVGFTITSLNILPILMGVVFYLQQKYTPKPVAATPEQAQQQKMMQWMSLLFPLFLYNGPSGLNLYILTSTTIGIFENRIIREHIKQREEAEKAGRVFVETKPTRASKQKDKLMPVEKEQPKAGCLGGGPIGRWMADLQQRAAQMQKEAERAKKRR